VPSIDETARRVATLLSAPSGGMSDPSGSQLDFLAPSAPERLTRGGPPADCWAVDGGQALVADARCLQVAATRASRVRWRQGRSELEEEGELRVHLLGGSESRTALAALGAPVAADAPVDINLLRDWGEWEVVARCVDEARPGALVLVDGDLQPDWRIPSAWLAALLARAAEREVTLVGVTKHSSLARGGAPLLGQLEREAEAVLGPRTMWWVPVARQRADVGPGLLVVVARLDPDARFAFRIDLPANLNAPALLGALSALCDDAAFPGYPYPLSVADRLAACGSWVRSEVWDQLLRGFEQAGLPDEVRDRAFADRHRLMERS
jgi:hypothetical protein